MTEATGREGNDKRAAALGGDSEGVAVHTGRHDGKTTTPRECEKVIGRSWDKANIY